jgi:transposase
VATSFVPILYTGWRRETGKFEVDYEIPPRGQVSSAHAIRTWVRNFEETGSALKKKA